MEILALFSRVSRALPGTSQLMDLKVCWDQLFLSTSFLQSCGLLPACCSHCANWRVIVSPLILRLALEAGVDGTLLEGSG